MIALSTHTIFIPLNNSTTFEGSKNRYSFGHFKTPPLDYTKLHLFLT